jgi:hypothetical protein
VSVSAFQQVQKSANQARPAPPRPQLIRDPVSATDNRVETLQRTVGNQAMLRTLGEGANGGAAAPILQRQDAGGANPTTSMPANTQTPVGGGTQGATPTNGGPAAPGWSANLLDAAIEDSNNPQCLGTVHAGGGLQFSANCGNIKGPFCQAAGVHFSVDFTVDATNAPRASGFTPPTVSVQLIFVNSAGATTQNISKQDTKPKYVSAGVALEPAFGHDFPFSTMESGWLHIHLQLVDPDTGTTADYRDRVTFTVTPCT